jgi:hypothetical protein
VPRESLEKSEQSEEAKEEAADVFRQISSGFLSRRDSNVSTVSALSFPASLVSLNRSLLYIKPNANTTEIQALVMEYLTARQYNVVAHGEISSEELSSCVDKQYADVSKKALVLAPHECSLSSLSMMAFEKKFRISWSVAVKKKLVQNAREACDILGASPEELSRAWVESVRHDKVVKLGRGFYCGYIDTILNRPAVFVINGYFMAMRAEYVAPAASVHYFSIEWDNATCNWADFRKKVIGTIDPAKAHPESLRSVISCKWRELGLARPLDTVSNGIHASASAFEALAESSIWLRTSVETDRFGEELTKAGVSPEIMRDWLMNVSVKGKPVFDHMEDKGSRDCVETAKQLLLAGAAKRKYHFLFVLAFRSILTFLIIYITHFLSANPHRSNQSEKDLSEGHRVLRKQRVLLLPGRVRLAPPGVHPPHAQAPLRPLRRDAHALSGRPAAATGLAFSPG